MALADATELSREWRDHVQKDIDSLLAISRQNATSIAELRKVAEAHQDRLAKLEAAPAGWRDWLGVIIMASGCLVTPLISAVLAVLGSLLVWIITHH